jgi:putative transposase
VTYAIESHGLSERQACRTLNLSRSAFRYQRLPSGDKPIEQELYKLAEAHPRWGCGKMIDYLRNQGYPWNHKRIRRIYLALGLNLRRKPKKRLPARTAQALAVPEQSNQSWSLDFMSDSLSNGRAFRTLNILDDFNQSGSPVDRSGHVFACRARHSCLGKPD